MPDLTSSLPSALRAAARWERLGAARIPVMLVHPSWGADEPAPVMVWMHGRTVTKETDPGRYLRWMRAGIGACAIDLPGHGERFDATLQEPSRSLDVVLQMLDEIDVVTSELRGWAEFDSDRIGIGGMSAGGMTTLVRLCQPHSFRCASVEATSGAWSHQQHREMFKGRDKQLLARLDPIRNLRGWREIPFQALHTRGDEWVSYEGQAAFINALRDRYGDPEKVEFITYENSGAPFEHAGFGRHAADAKNRQRDFLRRWLAQSESGATYQR